LRADRQDGWVVMLRVIVVFEEHDRTVSEVRVSAGLLGP
jgi:hypothetical protein